jgi:hypothetical protein
VLTIINFCKETIGFEINDLRLAGNFVNIFTSAEEYLSSPKYFELPAWGYAVFEKR